MINKLRLWIKKRWMIKIDHGINSKRLAYFYYKIGKNTSTLIGKNNLINLENSLILNTTMDVIGNDNSIYIQDRCQISNLLIRVRGNNHKIILGARSSYLGGVIWIEDDHCKLEIGSGTTIVEATIGVTESGSQVTIGNDCMFAHGIEIRCGDSHAIFDNKSGKRINHAENINIGKHVWIASDVMVLKGVTIGDDSVIAARALVTKSFPSNSLIGGTPAKILKEDISWDRNRLDSKKLEK